MARTQLFVKSLLLVVGILLVPIELGSIAPWDTAHAADAPAAESPPSYWCQGCLNEVQESPHTGFYKASMWIFSYYCDENTEGPCVMCPTEAVDCESYDVHWYGEGNHTVYNDALAEANSLLSCGDCDPVYRQFTDITSDVEQGIASEVALAISESGGRFWINEERSAIQGLGCGAGLSIHIPISASLFSAIHQELAMIAIKG
jgi:hypothetical protein